MSAPVGAVVFATAPTDDGGAAALLPLGSATVLRRLVEQLASLQARPVHVITRPGWEAGCVSAVHGLADVRVLASEDLAADLRTVSALATERDDALLLALGDVVLQRDSLAGLLADPRVRTGVLSGGGALARPWAPRTRSVRGRLVSAASPFHSTRQPTSRFLGVLKVHPDDLAALAASTAELATLAAAPPPEWEETLTARTERWHQILARRAAAELGLPPTEEGPAEAPISAEAGAELARRARALREDAASLCLVGLVRSGVQIANSALRGFFWARPLDAAAAQAAAEALPGYDEERLMLAAAVKGSDGFFTTFFVSPYSRYIARWTARLGLTPNAVTTFSMALGALAAAAFATGERWGMVAGAVLLQLAFTFDCVDGQLARYTRQFSSLGAWLDSVFDRGKEYLVFVGLALGASRGWDDDVWALACAAITLQTVRHAVDFSYAAGAHQAIAQAPRLPLAQSADVLVAPDEAPAGPDDPVDPTESAAARGVVDPDDVPVAAAVGAPVAVSGPPAPLPATPSPAVPAGDVAAEAEHDAALEPERPALPLHVRVGKAAVRLSRRTERAKAARWAKKIFVLPIGERFALISVTAAFWTPRVTFLALLWWGGLAAAYSTLGKILRSVAR
ncbi:CDP-alcohol phosphatidyltransferase family protein [Motilibacter deserti]|uniref:CDP-alcohol phosphatidyltransferase family protein n=1 Tax=Motilibacter deserti TaxID=2714956 RepID=UPI002F2B830D